MLTRLQEQTVCKRRPSTGAGRKSWCRWLILGVPSSNEIFMVVEVKTHIFIGATLKFSNFM